MVKIFSGLWTRIRDLGVPWIFLIAVVAAAAIMLIAIAFGCWGGLFILPGALFFLTFFGAAFVAAVGRSRFLPRAEGLQFLLPVLGALVLVIGSGITGIRAAQFLNDSLFHMSHGTC